MYYYGGRETSDCEPGQYRPIVYHSRQVFANDYVSAVDFLSDNLEKIDYLGSPLPDLETATEAAYDWASDRGLFPLELE